jgi:hypothetical protein
MSLTQQQLTFQISPITLTGGIASTITGGLLPLIALTNPNAFSQNLLTGNSDFQLEDAFGIFSPVAGGTLVEQQPAEYPFANLSVAANAIIRNPIIVSLIMITPMKQQSAWSVKLQTMQALKATLDAHNNAGGTYTVYTPAYTYTNMLMVNLTDVSGPGSPIPQNAWKWDFTRPLVSLEDASGALSNLMNQINSGVPSSGDTTSVPTAAGNPPSTTNTGPGAGASSPMISQTPFTTTSGPTSIATFDPITNQPTVGGVGTFQ